VTRTILPAQHPTGGNLRNLTLSMWLCVTQDNLPAKPVGVPQHSYTGVCLAASWHMWPTFS